MENTIWKKYLAIGIMFLFIGASVLPIISGTTQNLNDKINSGTLGNKHQPKAHQTTVGDGKNTVAHTDINLTHNPIQKSHPTVKPTEQKPKVRAPSQQTKVNQLLASFFDQLKIGRSSHSILPFSGSPSKNSGARSQVKETSQGVGTLSGVKTRSGPLPLDGYTVHDITSNHGFNDIQTAINDESTQNGDLITVDAGTYYGSVNITKRITLKSNNSDSIIDAKGWQDDIVILANNVTIYGFNLTNASIGGIYSPAYSGFTILNNTFWNNSWGFAYIDGQIEPPSHYRIYQNVIHDNTFYISSDNAGVMVDLAFDYDYSSHATFTMDNLIITNNVMHLSGTNTIGVDLIPIYGSGGFFIDRVNDSTITLGTINISENVILDGKYGIGFMGGFEGLSNVQVTTGDLVFNNNTLWGQSDAGIACLPYSGVGWHGTTHGVFGKISAQGNNIITSGLQSIGIAIGYNSMYMSGFYNYTGTAHAQTGDMLIQNNTIMSNGGGIYLMMYSVGGNNATTGLYDHAIVSTGNFILNHNTVNINNYPAITIDVSYCGVYLHNYASVTLGSFFVNSNDLSGGNDGIYVGGISGPWGGFEYLGYEMYDYSAFTIGDIAFNNNTIVSSGGNGIYVSDIDYIGYDMYNHSTCTMGDIQFNDNHIESNSGGIDIGYLGEFGKNLGVGPNDDTLFSMGNIEVNTNTITSYGRGIYAQYSGIGIYMYGSSKCMMGDVLFNDNIIHTYEAEGIYLDNFGCFGLFNYNDTLFAMGSIEVNRNNITSENADGIHVGDLYYFGFGMHNNTVFTMGDVTFDSNILSVLGSGGIGTGLYINFIGYFGENMGNSASFTMGDIHMDSNHINTTLSASGNGIYAEYSDFGEELRNNAVVHMGDVTFNSNVIRTNDTNGYGIKLWDFDWFGNYMYNNSIFTMGDLQINNNTIHSFDKGLQLGNHSYEGGEGWLGWFGVYMSGHAQATMGNIETNDNHITSIHSDGIYVDYEYYGSYLMDYAKFTMGSITFNNNVVNCATQTQITDNISDTVHLARGYNQGLYNAVTETHYTHYSSPANTEWSPILSAPVADPTTLSYTDWEDAVGGNPPHMVGKVIYMHIISEHRYFQMNFTYWKAGGGGGFSYTRYELIHSEGWVVGEGVTFTRPNSGWGTSIYFRDIVDIGYDMENNSKVTMGNLEADYNNLTTGAGNGIYIEYREYGYNMGMTGNDHCVFTMGDITCNYNTIKNSGSEGVYTSDVDDFGSNMHGSSTFTMGNIQFNHNNITTIDSSGLEISDPERYGNYMYNNSQYTMGNLEANNNTINAGNGHGIYMYYDEFGYYMGVKATDHCVFVMGDITCNNNNITNSGNDGIYVSEIDYIGYMMYGFSTCTIGNIQINHNNINTSNDNGLYIEWIGDIGEYMHNNSQCTIGNIESNYNQIYAGDGYGIYMDYGDIAYNIGGTEIDPCVFTMGDITCDYNNINNSGSQGIYIYDISYIGYEIYGSSTATIGNIAINHNNINTTGNYGLYIDWLGDIGERLFDDSQVSIGSIEINNNYLNDGWGDGIDFWIGDIGYNLNNNATVTVRHITMNHNDVISGDDGITDEWSGDFATDVSDNARYYGKGLILAYNTIDTTNDGIRILGGTYGLIVGANTILKAGKGIDVKQDSNNLVVGYNTMNGTVNDGIKFDSTYESMIIGNFINSSQNMSGIELTHYSHNNTILRNTISNNSDTGINLTLAWNNTIYHNNILYNDLLQAYDNSSAGNMWDNGYPSGGNYWSDYIGHDSFSGPNQDIPGSDGIGDTPYNITGYIPLNKDRYPFTHSVVINHKSIYTPSDPSPSNGATGVSITTNLSWTGGDPDHDYNNYDVYFGTTNPPTYLDTVYFTNQTRISYHPGTLTTDTTYYWKIIAWDAFNDTASGPVWSFYTGTPSTPPSSPWPPADNSIPVSDPDGPYSGMVNKPVHFDGSGSYDNDTWIIQFDWQFFSGDSWHYVGAMPTYTYASSGTYTVTLRVHDAGGHTAEATTTATISPAGANQPPTTPTITGPSTGKTDTPYTYSFVSTEPENENIQYFIDWGDGTTSTSPVLASGASYSATHTWTSSNVYTIKAYAMDQYNATSGTATLAVGINAQSVPGGQGYFIDLNGDGIYDQFHSNATGKTTSVQRLDNGSYLVDLNGDGTWDHLYNPATGVFSAYSPAPAIPTFFGYDWTFTCGLGILLLIILIIILILLMRRRRQKQGKK